MVFEGYLRRRRERAGSENQTVLKTAGTDQQSIGHHRVDGEDFHNALILPQVQQCRARSVDGVP